MPWRNRSPRTRMPTPKWQPCLSRGLSRGDTLITAPISPWPSSGLNHQRHRSAGTSSHALGEETGTLRPLTAKQLVGRRETFEKGLFFFQAEDGIRDWSVTGVQTCALPISAKKRPRLNDGKCDRRGRFFAGGMDDKEELKLCGLWRLDPDLSVTLVDDGIICSNEIGRASCRERV